VEPLLERHAEAEPIFGPLARATMALLARYSDAEIALLLDFWQRANVMTQQQIDRIRLETRSETRSTPEPRRP
jgi:hypothetical protein